MRPCPSLPFRPLISRLREGEGTSWIPGSLQRPAPVDVSFRGDAKRRRSGELRDFWNTVLKRDDFSDGILLGLIDGEQATMINIDNNDGCAQGMWSGAIYSRIYD